MSAPRVENPPDARAFCELAEPLLLRDEVRHGWLLGIARRCAREPDAAEAPWFGIVRAGDALRAVALQTPARALLVSDATEAELVPLVRNLRERATSLSGVRGPAETAATFGRLWSRSADVEHVPHLAQALHRLDRLAWKPDVPGRLRPAARDELELLRHWTQAFAVEARLPDAPARPPERLAALDEERLYVWDDAGPVATAAWLRPTPNGVSIGHVYTPPELRGRGYASALVAALSQLLLDGGKSFCCLFTDLANPVSNRIYARLGFERVGDFRYDRFVG